jgi:hypothetical protein
VEKQVEDPQRGGQIHGDEEQRETGIARLLAEPGGARGEQDQSEDDPVERRCRLQRLP